MSKDDRGMTRRIVATGITRKKEREEERRPRRFGGWLLVPCVRLVVSLGQVSVYNKALYGAARRCKEVSSTLRLPVGSNGAAYFIHCRPSTPAAALFNFL